MIHHSHCALIKESFMKSVYWTETWELPSSLAQYNYVPPLSIQLSTFILIEIGGRYLALFKNKV